jgi:hypothetical protein
MKEKPRSVPANAVKQSGGYLPGCFVSRSDGAAIRSGGCVLKVFCLTGRDCHAVTEIMKEKPRSVLANAVKQFSSISRAASCLEVTALLSAVAAVPCQFFS